VREGYDPASIEDPIYFNHRERNAFVQLDTELYRCLQAGQVRL